MTQLMGLDHPETAWLLLNLAALEEEPGESSKALSHIRQALIRMHNRLGSGHLSTACAFQSMAELARSVHQPRCSVSAGFSADRGV